MYSESSNLSMASGEKTTKKHTVKSERSVSMKLKVCSDVVVRVVLVVLALLGYRSVRLQPFVHKLTFFGKQYVNIDNALYIL